MTPTAQIAAIRQRAERAYPRGVSDIRHDGTPVYTQMGDPVADVRFLLAAWDTHQSALRALVAQWRETGKLFRTRAIAQMATRTTSGRIAADAFDASADAHFSVADVVERLLESEP